MHDIREFEWGSLGTDLHIYRAVSRYLQGFLRLYASCRICILSPCCDIGLRTDIDRC